MFGFKTGAQLRTEINTMAAANKASDIVKTAYSVDELSRAAQSARREVEGGGGGAEGFVIAAIIIAAIYIPLGWLFVFPALFAEGWGKKLSAWLFGVWAVLFVLGSMAMGLESAFEFVLTPVFVVLSLLGIV